MALPLEKELKIVYFNQMVDGMNDLATVKSLAKETYWQSVSKEHLYFLWMRGDYEKVMGEEEEAKEQGSEADAL